MEHRPASDSEGKRLYVEVWSDLICPWCGIGEKHFAEALRMFPHRERVELVLRSFRLMPGKTPSPVREVLEDKYELTPEEVDEALKNLEDKAKAVGLTYNLSASYAGDTIDGHRLVKLARESGREREVFARFFTACMAEGARYADPAVLLRLGLEAGLETSQIEAVLSSDAYRDDVLAEEADMKAFGGHAVPFFVINRKHTYSGALAPTVLFEALQKAWDEAAPEELATFAGGDGEGCGPEGCLI